MIRSTFTSIVMVLMLSLSAQDKYTEKISTEDVAIQFKWKYPMTGGVAGPAELLLKVKNKNDDAISISFEVAYTMNIRTVATFAVDTCIKAKKTINGKMNGLYFIAPDLTNDELMSDGFVWEINDLAVEEIEKCPVDK